jgi:hypothetical protein
MLAFLNAPHTRAATIVRYVAPAGACGDRTPCYATIQSSVDAAESGDEIRIAEGVYTEVNHYAGLAQLVYLSKTVTLRGGYAIDDWDSSMPITHPTVLDAQLAGRGLYIIGPISPTIENLNIVDGDATGLGGTPRVQGGSAGGGLYAISTTVTLRNIVWYHNHADEGGAAYGQNSHLHLLNSSILSNTGTIGGAVSLDWSDSVLANNAIADNRAGDGGGLAVFLGRAELSGNRILSNWSSAHGGGVLFTVADGSLVGNIITGNVGQTGGGASLQGNLLISQNTVSENSAEWGGGLALWDGNISLIGNTITDNGSSFLGGGVAVSYSSSEGDPNMKLIADNVISGNTSVTGGGLWFQLSQAALMGNLIQDNLAQEIGGGIYALESSGAFDKSFNIVRRSSSRPIDACLGASTTS